MKLRAIDDPVLGKWITKWEDTFLGHDNQNEIMSHTILPDVARDICPNLYSLICDEYTDRTNKEQLDAHEDFLEFYSVPYIESLKKETTLRLKVMWKS